MFTSSSRGWNTKLWAVCGVLAILSLSLVFAAGCASGGAEPQMQTGAVTVYTYDADAPADASARFFYSKEKDEEKTVWDESRTAWCVEATPKEAIGAIGLETAPYTKESPYPEFLLNSADGSKSVKLDATAMVYVVNNWDRPITITETSAPEEDLVYALPTGKDLINATMGNDGRGLYAWLKDGPGLFSSYCAGWLFPHQELTPDQEAYETWEKALYYSEAVSGKRHPFIVGLHVDSDMIQGKEIRPQERSEEPMKVKLEYRAESTGATPADTPVQMLAVAFSTYFGAQLNFQY
jgi:hypothetical protein